MLTTTTLFSFFYNDTTTTEIYTLSLHDALPISEGGGEKHVPFPRMVQLGQLQSKCLKRSRARRAALRDRKSTRLNSSHVEISYAVFCLKKKKTKVDDYNHTSMPLPTLQAHNMSS